MRSRTCDVFLAKLRGLSDARILFNVEIIHGFLIRKRRLCCISEIIGPSIFGNCPSTVIFNSKVIYPSNESEGSILSPVATP